MTQLIHFTAPLCVTRSFPVAGIPRSETSPELAENIRGLPPQKSVAMILEFDEDGEKANGELSAPTGGRSHRTDQSSRADGTYIGLRVNPVTQVRPMWT